MVRGAVTEPLHRPKPTQSLVTLTSLPQSLTPKITFQTRASLPIVHNTTQKNTRIYGFKRETGENLTFGGDDGSDDA